MIYTNRLIHYGGVILLGLGVLLLPASPVARGIISGLISYVLLSIIYWLLFSVFLRKIYQGHPTRSLNFAMISNFICAISLGVLITGIVTRNSPSIETGVFFFLVGIEFYVTRKEWKPDTEKQLG